MDSGQLSSVPESVTELSKLSVYNLREILRTNNILDCGTKDELVISVGLLKSGRVYLAFQRELEAMMNLISAVTPIITAEKSLYLGDPRILHKKRKFDWHKKAKRHCLHTSQETKFSTGCPSRNHSRQPRGSAGAFEKRNRSLPEAHTRNI